ncbi:MAG: alpha-1,2-fucosyltransferase, partial [Pseudomonadota bacterium]
QVAHGVALGQRLGREVAFTDLTAVTGRVTRKWELDCFGIPRLPNTRATALLMRARLQAARRLQKLHSRLHLGVLDEDTGQTADTFPGQVRVCSGYWQGEAFFADAAALVKARLAFPALAHPPLERRAEVPHVAVHVRRGDYLTDPVARAYHLVCDEGWYKRAIEEMRARVPGARFHIFSDDPDWSETVFAGADDTDVMRGPPDAPAWTDMAAMSRYDHWVISNSSYSWWASYLGKAQESNIIAPDRWFAQTPTKDLPICCADWICM